MYTSYSHEVRTNKDASTKYTEYLKSVKDGSIFDSRSGGKKTKGGTVNKTPSRNQPRRPGPGALLPVSDNEVKFSNIFSPNESNALKLQLLHKTSSLPVLHQDGDDNNDGDELVGEDVDPAVASRRRSSASALVHGTDPNTNNHGARKGESESVANILYSTLRAGNEYENPSADETLHTGSDSKVDYDPHEPLPAVDQLALRHELLHNIRAISRATYFEDLYTGKVRHNLDSPEAEVLQLLQNAPRDGSTTAKHRKNDPPKDVTLRRVDRWVQEASEVSSHPQNNDTDEDKQNQNTSLFHQSVWEENKNKKRGRNKPVNKKSRNQEKTTSDGSNTESEVDTASVYHPRNLPPNNPPKIVAKFVPTNSTNNSSDVRPVVLASRNVGSNPSANFDPQYLRAKYLTVHDTETDSAGMKRPFSFARNSHDGSVPLSVSLPNVAHQNRYLSTSTPSEPHGLPTSYQSLSRSRPENLHHSVANNSVIIRKDKIGKRDSDKHNTVQVRKAVQPKPPLAAPVARHPQRAAGGKEGPNNRGHAARASKPERNQGPPIYQRLNKNQWVMKKVWFHVNGDEHIPRFEFRFRHGKDIRDWDQLLDILTKRFPSLPTGARHIFTTDGYQISGLDELVHENSYIVSSTKKMKALRDRSHDGDRFTNAEETKVKPSLYKNSHRQLTRMISASEGHLNLRRSPEPLQRQSPQKSLSSLNTKYVSEEVPKLVAHVIEEASGSVSSSSSSPLARQPIRIINGSKPSLQSQVLLNTKTSQPFEDLVLDLAMSVRIPKHPIANQLHTLAGRQITSYSQLRSELKAGQRAFFVYSSVPEEDKSSTSSSQRNNVSHSRNGKSPLVKAILGKVNSNSSSDLSDIGENRSKRRIRRRSIPSPHSTTRFSNNSRYDSPIISRRSPFDVRRR